MENSPDETLLVSVCTGSWVYSKAGLLDDRKATNRKYGDSSEDTVPIDRLAEIAPEADIDDHRIVDTGRIVTAGGISSGLEMGFHLLSRFGYDEEFIEEVANITEYDQQWELMKDDVLVPDGGGVAGLARRYRSIRSAYSPMCSASLSR